MCWMVDNVKTRFCIETEVEEHHWNICLYQAVSSAVAVGVINAVHHNSTTDKKNSRAWVGSSGKYNVQARWTGTMVYPWTGRGHLLFAPWRSERKLSPRTIVILTGFPLPIALIRASLWNSLLGLFWLHVSHWPCLFMWINLHPCLTLEDESDKFLGSVVTSYKIAWLYKPEDHNPNYHKLFAELIALFMRVGD